MILSILFVALVFASCTKTEYTESNNIIEPSEVKNEIGKANVIIVDARSKEDYDKGHIKGAIHLEASELSTTRPIPGMLRSKADIEKVLSNKGISNDAILYVYDNNDGVFASRVWWTLKGYGHENIKVINKGEKGLIEAKVELSLEATSLPKTSYSAKDFQENKVVNLEEMKKITSDEKSKTCIIDVRSTAEFDEGAIPKAILYPHTKNIYTDGAFKSTRNIYLSYNELGLKREDLIILYCKTSFRATQTALLLEEAGFTNVKVYDGAWEEWSKEFPTEKQVEKPVTTTQDGS
jgi:thiosulfate/3-mercaptopyruvate sulfurtransferase